MCVRYRIAGALFFDSFFCFSHLSVQSFVGWFFFVDLIRTNRVVNKRNKAFCRNEHLFRIEFGFTSTFPVMSLPNFAKRIHWRNGFCYCLCYDFPSIQSMCNFLASALRTLPVCCVYHQMIMYSIAFINEQKATGITTVHQIIDCALRMWNDGWILYPNNLHCSQCDHIFYLSLFSPFFSQCSPTANRFHPFHFSNDLVAEHRMCFHIRSTVRPLSAFDRIDWYVNICGRSSVQEEFSIKKKYVKNFRRHSAWSIERNVWKMGRNFIGSLSH